MAMTKLAELGTIAMTAAVTGCGMGFIQGLFASWLASDRAGQMAFTEAAGELGLLAGAVLGIAIYFCLRRRVGFGDFARIVTSATAIGCTSALLLALVEAGWLSIVVTPVVALWTALSIRSRRRADLAGAAN